MQDCVEVLDFQEGKGHALSTRLYMSLPVLENIWLDLSKDFMLGLPHTRNRRDFIMVVVDRFSKIVHFIACEKTEDAISVMHCSFKSLRICMV